MKCRSGLGGPANVTFNLNYGSNLTSQIAASSITPHPDFTGFNSPSVNDDLALIRLSQPVPAGVPIYSLASADMVAGSTRITLIGYGQSGTGTSGYTVSPSFSVKRRGENMVDAFYGQDDSSRSAANEVFRFDFDGPKPGTNKMGGRSLGNNVETTLGGGDSGGPSFILSGGRYVLAGVNTFTQGFTAPKFGSLGGGINIYPYLPWISSVTGIATSGSSGSTLLAAPTGGTTVPVMAEEVASAAVVVSWSQVAVGQTLSWNETDSDATNSPADSSVSQAIVVDMAMRTSQPVVVDHYSVRAAVRRAAAPSRQRESGASASDPHESTDQSRPSLQDILSDWEGVF